LASDDNSLNNALPMFRDNMRKYNARRKFRSNILALQVRETCTAG